MANTFRKVYKKTGNSGNDSDYELIANVGVNGVDLDIMKGASSSTDGELGLVPKPTKDKYKFFLRASGIWDCIYPIGSIYLSVNNINPSEYFGGTWVAWGSGRVPVGVNSSDSSFNTVEKTGGSKTHNHIITIHNNAGEYYTYDTKLSKSQLPSITGHIVLHNGSVATMIHDATGCFVKKEVNTNYLSPVPGQQVSGAQSVGDIYFDNGGKGIGHNHLIPQHTHTNTVFSADNNQPYITFYMLKLTS